MNKLQIFTILILLGIGISCHAQDLKENPVGYKIDGHILGLEENSKIYLINGGQRKRIDSAIVTKNHFTMTGKLDEPAYTYLYVGKSNKLADILLDNRAIEIRGNKPVYDSIKVSGSEIDIQWKKWFKDDQRIGYQKYRLDKLYKSLVEKKDLESAITVKSLSEELVIDRINLLKDYVMRYNDSASGAVLPTLCPLVTSLTKSDYLEMYNALTLKMRSTAFGKEILDLAENAKLK